MDTYLKDQLKQRINDYGYEKISTVLRQQIKIVCQERGLREPDDDNIFINDKTGSLFIVFDDLNQSDTAELVNIAISQSLQILASTPTTKKEESESININTWLKFVFTFTNVIFIGFFVLWFSNFISSPDFRDWYSTILSESGIGLINIITFSTFPLISFVVSFWAILSHYKLVPNYKLWKSFLLFEIPALFISFFANIIVSEMPLTDVLRFVIFGAYILLLIVWFIEIHKLSTPGVRGSVAKLCASAITHASIVYLFLVTIIPLMLVVVNETYSSIVRYKDYYKSIHALYDLIPPLLTLIPLTISYFIIKKMNTIYHEEYTAVLASRPKTAQVIFWSTPLTLILVLFLASWQRIDEQYITQVNKVGVDSVSYEEVENNAQVLVDKKDQLDKQLALKFESRDMYLFESRDFTITQYDKPFDIFLNNYIKFVAFPFVNRNSEVEYNYYYGYARDSALALGYKRIYGQGYYGYENVKIAPLNQVKLLSRDVLVRSNGSKNFANVTITDSMKTFVSGDQEVVYEFYLPDNAVVTDLKLGTNLEFSGQIAPRGAAEQTYTEQVRRNIDPALLEQLGPRQYRLRIYPVPGVGNNPEFTIDGLQKVQFTYQVLREEEGIPLPVYVNEYNVLNNETEYSLVSDGGSVSFSSDKKFIKESGVTFVRCQEQTVTSDLTWGGRATLVLGQKETCATNDTTISSISGREVNILVSTALENKGKLETQLQDLKSLPVQFFANNNVKLYYYNSLLSKAIDLNSPNDVPTASSLTYFGKADLYTTLQNFVDRPRLLIVLAGDTAGLEINDSNLQNSPLYLSGTELVVIHNEAKLPVYSLYFTGLVTHLLKDLRVGTELKTELSNLGQEMNTGSMAVGENWRLSIDRSSGTTTAEILLPTSYPYDQISLNLLAEKVYIEDEIARLNSNLSSLNYLYFDNLHNRAFSLGIVTPISSYIALVDQFQQARLDELSLRSDRYTSEQRFTVTQPSSPRMMNPLSFGGGGGVGTMGLDGSSIGAPTSGGGLLSGSSEGHSFASDINNLPSTISGPLAIIIVTSLVLILGLIMYGVYLRLKKARQKESGGTE